MHACVVEHGDTTHLGPPRPVPPERRGRGVAVGAPPRRRPAVLLPAVAGSSAAAVDDARLLGPPRGRRAERQGAVHLLPPAAAVLTAAVAELSARHGEQQRERRAGRTRRELLQHPVLCSRCCCYFYQPGCSCSTRRGIYRDTDLRVVCSGNGNGCCQKRPVSGLCSRARRQSGRTAAGWERCERSSCAVPGVCACGSGRVGFLLYTDDDVQWLAFCGIAIWIQRRGERCVRVSCLSAAWRAVKGVRRAEGGSPMHSNCRRHGLVWLCCLLEIGRGWLRQSRFADHEERICYNRTFFFFYSVFYYSYSNHNFPYNQQGGAYTNVHGNILWCLCSRAIFF
jgi:hypothetical protein